MNRIVKSLKKLAIFSILAPVLLLSADEATRVEVGTRPLDEIEQDMDNRGTNYVLQEEVSNGFVFDQYPPLYFPNTYHWLAAVSAAGDQVELDDGSVWRINSYDGYKALNWRSDDPLTITQNNRWFSKYTYKIINKNTGSSLEANLFQGPFINGENTRYVSTIDRDHGELLLSDSTYWEISSGDSHVFHSWAPNDAVIIGSNSGWDFSCEAILINVTMNNFVRAKQI